MTPVEEDGATSKRFESRPTPLVIPPTLRDGHTGQLCGGREVHRTSFGRKGRGDLCRPERERSDAHRDLEEKAGEGQTWVRGPSVKRGNLTFTRGTEEESREHELNEEVRKVYLENF